MSKAAKKEFVSDFRRFFLRGLATLLPTILTIVVLVKCFEFIHENISVHITRGVVWLVVKATEDYPRITEEDFPELTDTERNKYYKRLSVAPGTSKNDPVVMAQILEQYYADPRVQETVRLDKMQAQWVHGPRSLVGFAIAIVLVYMLGRLLASFIGRRLWGLLESVFGRVPGFKQIYPHVKQVTEFIFGEKKIEFSRVVAVPYPRQGLWSVGLVTGAGMKQVQQTLNEDDDYFVTIFIPSSPTPMTGYVITVRNSELIDLPISIEEAIRFTVSGGVIVPELQKLKPGLKLEAPTSPSLSRPEPKVEKPVNSG